MSGLYKENADCRALGSNCPQIQTFDAEPTHRQYHHAIGNEGKSISSLEPTSDNMITNDPIARESPSALLKSSRNPVEYSNMAVLFRHLGFHKTYIRQCDYRSDDEGKPIGSAYKENADCRASGSNCRLMQSAFLFVYHLSRNFIRLQYSV